MQDARLVDVIAALLTRGEVEAALNYQVKIPALLSTIGISIESAMNMQVSEVCMWLNQLPLLLNPPGSIPSGWDTFAWGKYMSEERCLE